MGIMVRVARLDAMQKIGRLDVVEEFSIAVLRFWCSNSYMYFSLDWFLFLLQRGFGVVILEWLKRLLYEA
jgi:hypothetical protein